MSSKFSFLEYWFPIAATLCEQALAGEPKLSEGLPKPLLGGALVFVAEFGQDFAGKFTIMLDRSILSEPLFGEGTDQEAGWKELLQEMCTAAAGEVYQKTKKTAQLKSFQVVEAQTSANGAYELRAESKGWTILVRDQIAEAPAEAAQPKPAAPAASAQAPAQPAAAAKPAAPAAPPVSADAPSAAAQSALSDMSNRGMELFLDVELEASLRFGSRELPLSEILELGPGDVVHLDRHIADPVDLLIGDKIVARGEVVLVNGNFGLRVTEVAEPQKRLESIRCLF